MRPRPLIAALTRMYGWGVWLLPGALRRTHGEEMVALFAERLAEGGTSTSAVHLLRRAARSFVDLFVQSAVARLGRRRRSPAARRTREREVGMTTVFSDVRFGFRALRRSPVYALTTLLTFSVAIAAASAVYSAARGLLLDPLPFPDPERLVFVGETGTEPVPEAYVTSRYVLDRVGAEVDGLNAVAAYNVWEATLTGVGDPKRLSGAVVSAPYFEALGRPPVLGRTFRPEDDGEGAPRRVVISHRLWVGRFGSDPAVVGRTVQLSGTGYEVVGVMPADFETPDQYTFSSSLRNPPDLWRTFRAADSRGSPQFRSYRGVARLAPGADLLRVRSALEVLRQSIGEEFPDWAEGSRIAVLPLQDQFTARARPTLLLLLGGVAFVLLAACINAMGLTLARGLDRLGDLRVRAALGAGRGALVRQMVTETMLLGAVGGVVGFVLAAVGVDVLLATAPPEVPRIQSIRLDATVVPAVAGLTLVFALAAGLLPSVRLLWGRGSPGSGLGARGNSDGRVQRRTLAAFSVAQVGLAVALLVGASLLLRSFARLASEDPGYDARGVVIAQLDLPETRYPELADRRRALEQMLSGLREDPAIAEAALVTSVPQHGYNNFGFGVGVPAQADTAVSPWARYRGVSPGYDRAMGLSVLQGRMIDVDDWSEDAEGRLQLAGVAVSEDFVRRWIPAGESPLGAVVDLRGMLGAHEVPIVGVVRDVKYESPGSPAEPEIYLPVTGRFLTVFLTVKGRGDARGVPARMKAIVQAVDPTLPMDDVFFQERLLASALAQQRTTLALMGGLAVFALILAAVGLYGVVAHGVSRRAREFGIRIAIGADTRSVLGGVMREGAAMAVVGGAIGTAAAVASARLLRSMLYEVGTTDPLAYGGALATVVAVSLLASWIPARRATRVDPVETLRRE